MSRHRQITDHLRHRVLSGELAPGTILPTTQEMAEQFETSTFTVQTALTPLVTEGLLERKRRVGTIVRHNPAVLTCAGIYCGNGLLDEWESAFTRELCRQLQRQLAEQGIQTVLHTDMRPDAEQVEPLPDLREAVDTHKIQALFVGVCDLDTLPWLLDLPVTSSFVTSDGIPNRVGFDGRDMFRLALGRLREQGCQEVGLISSIQVREDTHHDYFRFYEDFVATVAELGLSTRDEWVITPPHPITQHEAYGYDAFRALWEQPEHPQGLLVYPDTSARGTMTAMLERGVRVPEHLRVVFHRNTGVDWPCPLAVDWVVSDVTAWAAHMIEQVQQQKAGQPPEQIILPYRLQPNSPLSTQTYNVR